MSAPQGRTALAERTYLGFIWQSIGLSANTLLSLAHLVIMARLLSPEIFGQFALAAILISIMTIFTEFGLGAALIQKDKLNESDRRFVFFTNVTIALCFLLVIMLVSEAVIQYFELEIDPLLIKVLGINALVVSFGMVSKATLQREMRFNKIVFATTISYLFGTLIVGVSIAWLGFGIWALVIGLLVNNTILSVYFLYQAPVKIVQSGGKADAMKMVSYGAGLCGVQGVNQFSRQSDKLILASLSTLGFVGLYERSQQIQQMPGVFLGGVFDNVLFPALSRLSGDSRELGVHFFQFCAPAMMVSAYIAVCIYTFAAELVGILLGSKWVEAVPILELLAVLTFFQLLGRLSDTYVRAAGVFAASIKVKLAYLILVFLFALAGFGIGEGFGAIRGIVLASVLHVVMMLLVCANHSKYAVVDIAKRAQPAVVMAAALLLKNAWVLTIVGDNRVLVFLLIIATDMLLIVLLTRMSALVGYENKTYLDRRVGDFVGLIGERISGRKR